MCLEKNEWETEKRGIKSVRENVMSDLLGSETRWKVEYGWNEMKKIIR